MNISVVIPTFNRGQLLCRALDSVLAQKTQPAEVIVIDDGSTDLTAATIKSKYKDVVYYYKSNQGVSSARNSGIRIAAGDWVAFLDSDDEWLPSKLAAQAAALAQEPRMKICHTNEIWVRRHSRVNPKRKHRKFGGWIYKKCLPLCVVSPSSVLIHSSVFENVGDFDEGLPACEDYDLWLRISAFYPVLYLDEPLITKYGGHDDQLSKKFWGMDRFRIKAMEKMLSVESLRYEDRVATIAVLLDKIRVVLEGAYKHQNQDLIRECKEKVDQYKRLSEDLGVTSHD